MLLSILEPLLYLYESPHLVLKLKLLSKDFKRGVDFYYKEHHFSYPLLNKNNVHIYIIEALENNCQKCVKMCQKSDINEMLFVNITKYCIMNNLQNILWVSDYIDNHISHQCIHDCVLLSQKYIDTPFWLNYLFNQYKIKDVDLLLECHHWMSSDLLQLYFDNNVINQVKFSLSFPYLYKFKMENILLKYSQFIFDYQFIKIVESKNNWSKSFIFLFVSSYLKLHQPLSDNIINYISHKI